MERILSSKQRFGLERLLKDILKYEIDLKTRHSEAEIADIKSAVPELVRDVLYKAYESDPVFRMSEEDISKHIIAVGSVVENTKIFELDEFDFIFVLPHFDTGNTKVLTGADNNSAFRIITYQGPEKVRRKLLRRKLLFKRRGIPILSSVDIKLHFENRIRRAAEKLLYRTFSKIVKQRETGSLILKESSTTKQGVTLSFEWQRTESENVLNIDVDVTPCISCCDPEFFRHLTAPSRYADVVQEIGCVQLIPLNAFAYHLDLNHPKMKPILYLFGGDRERIWIALGKNYANDLNRCALTDEVVAQKSLFYISFVQAEKHIMQQILQHEPEWIDCYKLAKFFSEQHGNFLYQTAVLGEGTYLPEECRYVKFTSYVLKTMVLRNEASMEDISSKIEQGSLATKLMWLLDDMMNLLVAHKDNPLKVFVPSLWFENLSSMHILQPVAEPHDMERTYHLQRNDITRQIERLNSIVDFLLEISVDNDYTYKKYQGRLLVECIDNHAWYRFPGDHWKAALLRECNKADNVWELTRLDWHFSSKIT